METLSRIIGALLGLVFVLFFLSVIFAFPVKWLWNATMPELFNFKPIDWWMAWKLLVLSGFLVKTISTTSLKEQA